VTGRRELQTSPRPRKVRVYIQKKLKQNISIQ